MSDNLPHPDGPMAKPAECAACGRAQSARRAGGHCGQCRAERRKARRRRRRAPYRTKRWRVLRLAVYGREEGKCFKCGRPHPAAVMVCHHIRRPGAYNGAFWDPENCRMVCRPCHRAIGAGDVRHGWWRRAVRVYVAG